MCVRARVSVCVIEIVSILFHFGCCLPPKWYNREKWQGVSYHPLLFGDNICNSSSNNSSNNNSNKNSFEVIIIPEFVYIRNKSNYKENMKKGIAGRIIFQGKFSLFVNII